MLLTRSREDRTREKNVKIYANYDQSVTSQIQNTFAYRRTFRVHLVVVTLCKPMNF